MKEQGKPMYLALAGRQILLWYVNPGRRGVPLALGCYALPFQGDFVT